MLKLTKDGANYFIVHLMNEWEGALLDIKVYIFPIFS